MCRCPPPTAHRHRFRRCPLSRRDPSVGAAVSVAAPTEPHLEALTPHPFRPPAFAALHRQVRTGGRGVVLRRSSTRYRLPGILRKIHRFVVGTRTRLMGDHPGHDDPHRQQHRRHPRDDPPVEPAAFDDDLPVGAAQTRNGTGGADRALRGTARAPRTGLPRRGAAAIGSRNRTRVIAGVIAYLIGHLRPRPSHYAIRP